MAARTIPFVLKKKGSIYIYAFHRNKMLQLKIITCNNLTSKIIILNNWLVLYFLVFLHISIVSFTMLHLL